ncbi:MAG: indole-3-glycerol phosphate synthase TrpC [Chloroflexota bacterium]
MSILDEIFAHTRQEVARRKLALPLAEVRQQAAAAEPSLDFAGALRTARSAAGAPALIAEIKRASPSRGLLAPDFDPLRLAHIYRANGAAAISVLTEPRYFQGSLEILRQVRQAQPATPLLRKDFICDPYQLYEGRAAGADAVLLIVAGLEAALLRDLHTLSLELGLSPLVEVHNLAELELALACGAGLVGINNRDLGDFSVRLETSLELRSQAPAGVCLVAESGIHSRADVERLAQAGFDAILVGEALVTAADVAAQVRSLACTA